MFYVGFLSVLKYNVIGDEIEDEELLIKIVVYVSNRFKIKEQFLVVFVYKRKDGRYVVVE